ncbi:Asp-tRNA(Asn)/Glu-tRNA(Gln) amidotransferase subunit GatC [Pseudothermotoga sp.]|nr:Asp-tRNA(Asn)/Glu-tRNA(Gln) amidotransferase subunit GatC [Pseudothermotoga sp.]MCX7812061.1 Asp-tRNA(Asn)/Glu-tRNA(Gln) amidotransferase subunit GatC [Pseudothermotoga sp.]MDW8139131.1 Asp-tRNA(Asn)/Glu-tRNA(Gln) amidotransferase subunit GatC [Pseudothermotoga sp.]
MIKIDEILVKHLESLARLQLSEEQRKSIEKDMREILDYMELLNEVDVSGVEPMYTPIESNAELREDTVRPFEDVEAIRLNFPKRKDGHIVVPGIHA